MTDRIPNSYVNQASVKASFCFVITVKHTEVYKEHVFSRLEDLCDEILIAKEKHHFAGSWHHHIFMRTKIRYHIQDILTLVQEAYNYPLLDNIHIGTVKDTKKLIKYITKEDQKPLFKGLDTRAFNLNYTAIEWAENTEKFDSAHPFVLNHPQYYRYLENVHNSVKSKALATKTFKFRTYPTALSLTNSIDQMSLTNSQAEVSNQIAYYEDLKDWQKEVVEWWNDFVIGGHYHKRPQLYLYGDPNTGKTTFIKRLLSLCVYEISAPNKIKLSNVDEELEPYIFRPSPNEIKYAFESFNSSSHIISLIDEFDIQDWNVNELKKFMAGEALVTSVKFNSARKIQSKVPMIIVSNKKPPTVEMKAEYVGIAERIIAIETRGLMVS